MSAYFPQRIVSLQPSATVTLKDIAALDRVVACTRYCAEVVPEVEIGGRLIVADSWSAQAEQIIAAKPDLVIASVPYQLEAVAQILKSGVRFLGLAPKTLADIYTDMATIAGAVGLVQEGIQAVNAMQREIATIRDQMEQRRLASRPRVFCEEWGKPIIASQPWVAELVQAAGADFVGKPGQQISAEEVREAEPDFLVAAWCGAGDRVPLEKMVAQRGWQQMRAVHNGNVYCIPDPYLNTPASTLIKGLRALASILDPESSSAATGVRRIASSASTKQAVVK